MSSTRVTIDPAFDRKRVSFDSKRVSAFDMKRVSIQTLSGNEVYYLQGKCFNLKLLAMKFTTQHDLY